MYGKKGTGDRDDGWIRDGSGPGSLMFKACLTHTCKVPGLILSLFPVCLSAAWHLFWSEKITKKIHLQKGNKLK